MQRNESNGDRTRRTSRWVVAGVGAALLAFGAYRLLGHRQQPPADRDEPASEVEETPVRAELPPPPAPPAANPTPPTPAAASTPAVTSPEPSPPARPGAGLFGLRSGHSSPPLQQAAGRMGDALLMARLRAVAKTDPARAIELGRTGNLRYPHSPFAGERATIVVKALLGQGETAEARKEAETAVNRYPPGPWTGEIEQLTGVRRNPAAPPPAAPGR